MRTNFVNTSQDAMLIVLGINHKTAPVALRQKAAFAKDSIQTALVECAKTCKMTEVALLSTCNRTEWYCVSFSPRTIRELIQWWHQYLNIQIQDIEPYLYCHVNVQAVRHMMRVACGLDSMILGESQILGQLKDAFEIAQKIQTLGKGLNKLFQASFFVAKQIRTQTGIAQCPVSVAYTASRLAKTKFVDIKKARVLLIGAGAHIELVAVHLCQLGIGNIKIANRSIERAQKLAQRFKGQAIDLDSIKEHLSTVDIIISATGSPKPIVTVDMFKQISEKNPLFILDLAVPCDVEPQVGDDEHIDLYTIDDLQNVVESNKATRHKAAQQAYKIIEWHVKHYMQWLGSQEAIQELCLFRDKVNTLKTQELNKALESLRKGMAPERVMEYLAHNLTQKMMHEPSIQLKASAVTEEYEIG